jgi:hypothetical protein
VLRQVGLESFKIQDLAFGVLKLPGSSRKLSMKILLHIPEVLTKTLISKNEERAVLRNSMDKNANILTFSTAFK